MRVLACLACVAALAAPPPPFIQSSAAGDRLRPLPAPRFRKGLPKGVVVRVFPAEPCQPLEGIGGALTESSAYVLAHLPKATRAGILDRCFGPSGARFSMARIPIGACDFSVAGKWSYDDVAGDTALAHFSLAPDRWGFPGALDPSYALLPLIRDALAREPRLKLVASPWTAPAWMKDNGAWYGQGRGGSLLPEHHDTFARYMVKYLEACRAEGIRIWAVTPENEPVGNGGQWESMEFTPTALRDYIRDHLGPRLAASFPDVKLLSFDHNRDAHALTFADAVLGDPEAARYVWGTGLHWYSTTNSACPEVLDALRTRFPGKALLHTEGCIDGIGTADCSPGDRFLGWKNDAWWWTEAATDWGYYWAPPEEKPAHPRYAPVHRYARDLIVGLNRGLVGWIDWNLVLDARGGPNHVGNFCGAPILADPATGDVHITPLWDVMAHFSRYLQPGAHILRTETDRGDLDPDAFHATAALSADRRHLVVVAFNRSPKAVRYSIQVGGRHASLTIPANALQTWRFPRNHR